MREAAGPSRQRGGRRQIRCGGKRPGGRSMPEARSLAKPRGRRRPPGARKPVQHPFCRGTAPAGRRRYTARLVYSHSRLVRQNRTEDRCRQRRPRPGLLACRLPRDSAEGDLWQGVLQLHHVPGAAPVRVRKSPGQGRRGFEAGTVAGTPFLHRKVAQSGNPSRQTVFRHNREVRAADHRV